MAKKVSKVRKWLSGIVLVGCALFYFLIIAKSPAENMQRGAAAEEANKEPKGAKDGEPSPLPPLQQKIKKTLPRSPQKPDEKSLVHLAPATLEPQCKVDADCRGPKTPDCIEARCEASRCLFDNEACECVTNAECDDGDDCTRDLCFSSTKKCIHIPQECP